MSLKSDVEMLKQKVREMQDVKRRLVGADDALQKAKDAIDDLKTRTKALEDKTPKVP